MDVEKVAGAEEGDDRENEDGVDDRRLDLDVALEKDDDGGIRLGGLYIPPPPPPALTFDNDRPRLVITHIENENFKSYAGLQTLGPFHKSFTSIVGPNGSGKSNVIDSMLFVFGYRAQKIRSKKVSVLIHNSEKFPNVQRCTVRVFFQEIIDEGESKAVPVENSQFSVARTAFKDSSSFYEINGKRCPFKDVAVLLRQKGVDLDHNRFLILQGEVEQIAQMKPKGTTQHDTGMLEFLEDIIGSSRFQEPIDLLKRRVAELDELRTEKLARVKLVEKEKDELEGPRNKAIEYLRLENQVVEKKNMGYQQYINECGKKIADIENAKEEYEKGAASLISQVEQMQKQRQEKESEYNQVDKEMEKLNATLEEAQEEFKKHELEDAKLREDMKMMNMKRKKLMLVAKKEKEKIEHFHSLPETNRKKIEECQTLRDKLIDQREEEEKQKAEAVKAINLETKTYQDEKEQLETRLIELKKDVNEKDAALKEKETELALVNSNEEKEKCRLEQLVGSKGQSKTRLEQGEAREKDLKKLIPETEARVATFKRELDELVEKEAKLSQNVRRLQGSFEEKRSSLNAQKSRGRVIEAIMQEKTSGNIRGIFGRLGDLGAIDKKYDVAISTATGSGLDTILVDNVNTAKTCIEFLRRNNIGRSNFLALDKTLNWSRKVAEGRMKTPEDVPRLFDLIKPQDPRFATAFYHCVRDTLVASSLDQAHRIAFGQQRHRVVTLAGEVIETSGAMAGGGREVIRGKMGAELAEAKDEKGMHALEKELNEERERHNRCVQARTEKEQALHHSKKNLEEYKVEHQRLSAEMKVLRERNRDLDKEIAKQEKALAAAKPDPEKQCRLQKEIEKLTEAFEDSKAKSDEVEFEVKKLNGKIKDVVGSRLKTISKKLEDTKNRIDKLKEETTRLEVEIKSAERALEKANDNLTTLESEISEAEEKMLAMRSTKDAVEKQGLEAMEKLKKLKVEVEEAVDQKEKVAEELDDMKKAEAKFKSQQIEINQTREKYEAEIKDQSMKQAHWRREVKRLKLREIPGEPLQELKVYSEEELNEVDPKRWEYELNLMEEKMSSMKVNQAVIEEYRRKETVYLERVAELEEISGRKEKQRKNHEELRKQRLNEFMQGFSIITSKLKEMYQMITLGGDAELELVDSLDPFTEGIVFSVRPPNKSWKNISNLSGGEKTLSSLALVFALHYYKPTPLYVMDEIDAALDFKNVSIVANYIRERTKNAQFIIISLRSNMFELADRLVGIYKTFNCTKSVTINPAEYVRAN